MTISSTELKDLRSRLGVDVIVLSVAKSNLRVESEALQKLRNLPVLDDAARNIIDTATGIIDASIERMNTVITNSQTAVSSLKSAEQNLERAGNPSGGVA